MLTLRCTTQDVDCAGVWSGCTAACEDHSARSWTETTAQSGNGAACWAAWDCADGEGDCAFFTGIDCSAVSRGAPCNVMYLVDQVRDAGSLQDINPNTFCPCKWVRDAAPKYDPAVVTTCNGGGGR